MKKGYIKGIFVEISPELEERKLKAKIFNDEHAILEYLDEIARYKEAIRRAEKRIKINRKVLKSKFADIEQV